MLPTDRLTASGMPCRPSARSSAASRTAATCERGVGLAADVGLMRRVLADRPAPARAGPSDLGRRVPADGRGFARFAILGHEAAHRLLFPNKRVNDFVGRWLLAYPAFVPFDLYRRGHFAHHRDEFGPERARPQPLPRLPDHRPTSLRRKLHPRRVRQLRLEEPQGPAAALTSATAGRSRCRSSPCRSCSWRGLAARSGSRWLYLVLWLGAVDDACGG